MRSGAGGVWFSALITCVAAAPAAESGLGRSRFLEELLQDADDAAGLGQLAVLRSGVLQQHVAVAAALQELAAAEQGVVARLRLAYETLQAVHVLNGLRRGGKGVREGSG